MSKLKSKMIKMLAIALSLTLVMGVLAGCVGKKETGQDEQKRVLRIATMYGSRDYDDHIRTQYTDIFKFNNMNIDIEFVYAYDYSRNMYGNNPEEEQPDPVEEMKKLMQGDNPPDVVFLQSINELAALIEDNLLAPLDTLIESDKFDVSDFVPSVIDGLRQVGNDQLYALSPTFSSQALMYNKGIFLDRGVEFPRDGMYWDEVFDLASRVTSGEGPDRKAGFAFSTYYWGDMFNDMKNTYMAPLEMSIFAEDKQSLVVDSQAWEDVWNEMVRLDELDVFPGQPDYSGGMMDGRYNPYQHDAFLSGNLAMAVVQYYNINEVIRANRDADLIEGYEYIDWDVVTMPAHPQYPEIGGVVSMEPIMGINAKAQNSEDAWRFLKFLNGESWAELKSLSSNNLVSRKSYIKPKDNIQFNIEAFYTMMPAPVNTDQMYYSGRNSEVYWIIDSMGQEKFRKVTEGELEVREALMQWQTEGNSLLQQVKENPDKPAYELWNNMRGMNYGGMSMEHQMMMEASGQEIIWESSGDEDAPEPEVSDDSTDAPTKD